MHKTNKLPSNWKLANIMPIFQKGDHNSPANTGQSYLYLHVVKC